MKGAIGRIDYTPTSSQRSRNVGEYASDKLAEATEVDVSLPNDDEYPAPQTSVFPSVQHDLSKEPEEPVLGTRWSSTRAWSFPSRWNTDD